MSWAVAVPEGKTSFSLTIWSLRREETGQSNVTRVGVHAQVGTHNLPTKRGSEEDTAKIQSQSQFPIPQLARKAKRPHPKKATAALHAMRAPQLRKMGASPSRTGSSSSKAGMIPTSPAASGRVPVATAVVWRTTFSCGVNARVGRIAGGRGRCMRSLKIP